MKRALTFLMFLQIIGLQFPTRSIAVDNICIEDGKLMLAVVNGELVLTDPIKYENAEYEPVWIVPLKEGEGEIRLHPPLSSRHRSWGLKYVDKSKTVISGNGSSKWAVKGGTIQALDGANKGLYVSPGTEKVEADILGKKTFVGTRPILTEKPYDFSFVNTGG